MDDTETKLSVILEGIRQSEDRIYEVRRSTMKVQEQINCDVKDAEKFKEESIQLENEIKASKQLMASLEPEQFINKLQKSNLEEQASASELQVETKCKSLELLEQEGKKDMERFLEEGKNFYSRVRLDNPHISIRREALKQELQQLGLEKMRLLSEIKVLEDNNEEMESLQAEKHKYEVKFDELKKDMNCWEANMNKQLLEAQNERDHLLDLNSPHTNWLTLKLKCIREEGEYLKSAQLAMKREHQKLVQELRMQGSTKVSCPSATVKPQFRSRHQPLNTVSPQQHTNNCKSFPDNISITQESTETVLQDFSGSTVGKNISTASSQNLASSQVDEDNNVKVHDNKFTKSTGSSSNNLQENVHSKRTVITSTCQAGVTPSTPRTFTRNPPPPTPESEMESRPVIPLHLPDHFTCVSAPEEELDETLGMEDSCTTQALASVKDHSTSTCEVNNSPSRKPDTTSTSSTSIHKPKPAGHLGKGNSEKYSSCNSAGSSLVSTPLGEFSRDFSCEVVSDVPAKTAGESSQNFAPGWASLSSLGMDEDVPEERSMSYSSKEDRTLERNTQYHENISASTFASEWASISASHAEEDSSRKVSNCIYRNDITRNRTQDTQGNCGYPKNISGSHTKNSAESQLFISNSRQGNNFQNDKRKLLFKFRKTMVHMQTSVKESSTDCVKQNPYSNEKTRGNCTSSWSFRNPGISSQHHPDNHNRKHGYFNLYSSWNFKPLDNGYREQKAHDNHVTHNRN